MLQNRRQPFRLLAVAKIIIVKTSSIRFYLFILCSRQESNLERRYRKPIFYPLNYGSKHSTPAWREPHTTLKPKNFQQLVSEWFLEMFFW